ncbi:tyrosyl-DNA phosphodiesterase-domain-containing protein [Absidia repens]|uniref:Tyrosyl-DNA phosphodiesterase-domain-containing protein n=1 Tax=Absidia repens TaxID=90262 RepID=A0A1X2IUC4_9FUNG|nr:tyrosyl-DNA phosphodiesterase-domain-containing protein [Absidia repens]
MHNINSDDDNDDDLSHAIALSLQQDENDHHDSSPWQPQLSSIQLDRHEQEQQDMKLALALSLGKTVDQLTARDILMADSNTNQNYSDNKRAQPTPEEHDRSSWNSVKKKKISSTTTTFTKHWDGVIKLTYVRGFVGPSFIRFEDIVQKTQLKKAVVTAFVWTKDFLDEHFPEDVNVCIISHGRPPSRVQLRPNRILITPPLKDEKFGCFHIKLMLLFHQDSLRVVIGSANLEPYDYNDLENVVFIQDFPQRYDSSGSSASDLPQFAKDICNLLDEMHVPVSVKNEMKKYDFTKAKAHIVASVSGVFEGDDKYRKYGHTRLADIVNEIGANDPSKKPKIEMQTSSLGALTKSYLQELYTSFCGTHPYANQNIPKRNINQPLPPIDILYPSLNTVTTSRLGPPGAGTICLNRKSWQKSTFPKEIMCDTISYRPGTLMHSKYIIATLLDKGMDETASAKKLLSSSSSSSSEDKDKDKVLGWVYCGSHNATVSAWGKLTLAKNSKRPKMNISNWELGVVLPITKNSDFPTPYQRPAPRYQPGQEAWTQDMDY